MKNIQIFAFLFITISAVLVACSEDKSIPNSISEFNVTGMVCQHGCGGSIRKGLFEKEMATQVDVTFDEQTGLGNIAVYHNNIGVTTDQIKELIEDLNDGQFQVEFVRTKEYTAPAGSEAPTNNSVHEEESIVEAKQEMITLPNITDLLNSLIH
jgi:hypothetical protein